MTTTAGGQGGAESGVWEGDDSGACLHARTARTGGTSWGEGVPNKTRDVERRRGAPSTGQCGAGGGRARPSRAVHQVRSRGRDSKAAEPRWKPGAMGGPLCGAEVEVRRCVGAQRPTGPGGTALLADCDVRAPAPWRACARAARRGGPRRRRRGAPQLHRSAAAMPQPPPSGRVTRTRNALDGVKNVGGAVPTRMAPVLRSPCRRARRPTFRARG